MKIAFFRLISISAAFLGLCAALSACSSQPVLPRVANFLRPYRPDVQQGNVITRDMVEQIRPGMTRDQVRFMLGTPMLRDVFHEDRWDYPYMLTRGSGETQIRKLVVFFADGHVHHFESDAMPAEPLADTLIFEGRNELPELRTKPPGAKEDR
jgi:outer membrane protein assembly factor BamE